MESYDGTDTKMFFPVQPDKNETNFNGGDRKLLELRRMSILRDSPQVLNNQRGCLQLNAFGVLPGCVLPGLLHFIYVFFLQI